MTNEQKIKAYLEAGHWVKVGENVMTLIHDNWERLISSDGRKFSYSEFEYSTIEPIQRIPTAYEEWDKVLVLSNHQKDIAEMQDMVWNVCEIEWNNEIIYAVWNNKKDNFYYFPAYCLAPAFDDEKPTKIQELESQLAQIQKEIELLKK